MCSQVPTNHEADAVTQDRTKWRSNVLLMFKINFWNGFIFIWVSITKKSWAYKHKIQLKYKHWEFKTVTIMAITD